jgi:hypothetical protein
MTRQVGELVRWEFVPLMFITSQVITDQRTRILPRKIDTQGKDRGTNFESPVVKARHIILDNSASSIIVGGAMGTDAAAVINWLVRTLTAAKNGCRDWARGSEGQPRQAQFGPRPASWLKCIELTWKPARNITKSIETNTFSGAGHLRLRITSWCIWRIELNVAARKHPAACVGAYEFMAETSGTGLLCRRGPWGR